MKYGLIGEKLGHSYSKEIHESLGFYEYSLKEIAKEDLKDFILSKEYSGLNVTIPYKEQVMPYLDYIDDGAKAIGSVNTIVNKDGKLYGYNTDFYGLRDVLLRANFDLKDKKVLILGTGGTSKTAKAVATSLDAKEVIVVSRERREAYISYEDAYASHLDADYIINTTPAGMHPNIKAQAIDLSNFKSLLGVMDVIYNPGRTKFMLQAEKLNVKAAGGLYMLVSQAVHAAEFFLDRKIDPKETDRVYKKIKKQFENIVLIGMPASGKSTVGKILAKRLSRDLYDTDTCIVEKEKRKIPDIFASDGEKYFRDVETTCVIECSSKKNAVIATGGGAILREENVDALKAYGRLFFLDRDPNTLVPTKDRPLSNDFEKMKKLYKERYPKYMEACDFRIECLTDIEAEVKEIERHFDED